MPPALKGFFKIILTPVDIRNQLYPKRLLIRYVPIKRQVLVGKGKGFIEMKIFYRNPGHARVPKLSLR